MKTLLIISGLLLAYLALTFIRIKHILATAQLPAIVQSDQTIGHGPDLVYVAAGDSTAVGLGASSVEHSYTFQLAADLGKTQTVHYYNLGKIGAKTKGVIDKQMKMIADLKPHIITLSVGANDLVYGEKSAVIISNLKTITETLVQKTDARIYLTNIPIVDRTSLLPYFYRSYLASRLTSINKELLKLENKRVHIINIHGYGWDAYPDINKTFAADQFHPNDEGYNNWTRAFLEKIKKS